MFKINGLKNKFLIFIFITASSAMLILGWYGYQNAKTAYQKAAIDLAKGYTNEVAVHIKDFLQLSEKNLDFIANNYAIKRHSYWMDIGEKEKTEQYHEIIADTLRGFAVSYDYNFKIRLINNDGKEHIKILRDPITGSVKVTPENELEDKSDRDFFIETIKLNKGEIYTGALELYEQQGKIIMPYVPIVRVATPLIGDNKIRYGVIVVNIFAEHFFKYIEDANNNTQGRTFYLIAKNGDYLYHSDKEKCFSTQLGHHSHFEQDFPNLLTKLKLKDTDVIFDSGHIITYEKIILDKNKENYWLLVGIVPEKSALVDLQTFEVTFTCLALIIILLLLIATHYFLAGLIRPLLFINQQLKALGRGEVKLNTIDYSGNDELNEMLISTQSVVTNIENLAKIADAIGNGDFSKSINVLSEQDRLGLAIKNMSELLQHTKLQDEQRDWQRDGIEQLSKALTGDITTEQLANISISLLGHYLNAGRGVFYEYRTENKTLELIASYMYSNRHHVSNSFELGEGAVGQVARERKPIILGTLDLEQEKIITGTTCSIPLYTYTYPLLHENILLGVLELASFEYYSEIKLNFLQEAIHTISAFLYVVQQRERIKLLLQVSDAAEKAALEKSEKLQIANQQMQEQQQQLQKQTEELQQANQQMEEQQQQLQQQTEELRQTNAQMERASQQLEQQNRRLIETQQELDTRAKQLELSSRYKSEFLANMSHELRTPLNSIILLSKMMANNANSNLNSEEIHHAEIIHNAGQELLRLINDVLDLSKIEAGRMELHLSTISSQELLSELYGLFEASAKEKNLQFDIEDTLRADFISDMNRVSQILRNLLSNAFKFTKKGSIKFSISRVENSTLPIKFSVKDTGIGISEDKQQLIFEAFQQGDGSISRQYGGTGLGLSISLRFAQLLGGTIELNSQIGKGSEFSLLLPENAPYTNTNSLYVDTIQAKIQQQSEITNTVKTTDDRTNINTQDAIILLIDDDALFAQALLEINRKLGYKTLHAATGEQGLELAKQYHPKGILLDLGLPDMDGIDVLNKLKTQHNLADIPVYVVSAREKDAVLIEQGIIGYLQKPVNIQQISDAEAELLAFIEKSDVQTILVLENGSITIKQLNQLIANPNITLLKITTDQDITKLSLKPSCCLAIIDLDAASIEWSLQLANVLKIKNPKMNFVFLGQSNLTDEDQARIRHYSDSIIIKAPQSEQRLLKNIERFLTKTTYSQQKVNLHESGQRLIGWNILVVDDDTRNLFVITSALEKEGAKVSGVLNGKKALEFLEKNKVNMIFMDIMMPEMDGFETIKTIRNTAELSNLPIVALTAKALSSDREKALAVGADDYLAKPVEYEILINTAKVWCENQHKL